jgi:transposase InsO family protein
VDAVAGPRPTIRDRSRLRRDAGICGRTAGWTGDEEKSTMDALTPKDHAETVALFRSEIIGALCRRELGHGDLRAELVTLSHQRFRTPGADVTRAISIPTLERWYYAYRRGGLSALHPRPRADRGRGRRLTQEQRQLLLDIRRENPSASVPLILRTLILDGRLDRGAISPATVRRLYVGEGLDRVAMRDGTGAHTRLRWQAERPGALWHGDVCHGPALVITGKTMPLRIHGMLDDTSRFVVALEAMHTEREVDMLGLLTRALRRHGLPDAVYLDNGSTYSGATLRLGCERLGITLIHARPYSPEARGKMERFWRTLREGVLDHMGSLASLHDVNVRLWAFLDQHYHQAPHAGLLGRSPASVWQAAEPPVDDLDEQRLRAALTVTERRRVRRDTTVSIDGVIWQLDQGYLAGRIVTVGRCLVDANAAPWVEHEGKRLELHPVDPVKNGRTTERQPRRPGAQPPAIKTVPFDPAGALLDKAAGRAPALDIDHEDLF